MSTRKFTTRAVLRGHLLEVNGLPPVNWENQIFTAPTDGDGDNLPYIREIMAPADEVVSANGEKTGTGFYRLEYFVPIGDSISDAENKCDEIKEHFGPAITISGVQIERAFVGQGREEAPWTIIPIEIDYKTFETL